jgi:hypothetical protein
VTAWRSFRDADAERWAWIQIAPLASASDAESALSGVGERGLANLGSRVRRVSEAGISLQPFEGASAVWAREQKTEGYGGAGLVLMLGGRFATGWWSSAFPAHPNGTGHRPPHSQRSRPDVLHRSGQSSRRSLC